MKLITDDGQEIDIKELSVVDIHPGDLLVYHPSVTITQANFESLQEVIKFLEEHYQGLHVLMIPAGDRLEVMRREDVNHAG